MDIDLNKLMGEALVGAGTSVWAWDVSEDVLTGMAGSVALLGYAKDELESTQTAWNEVIHPDDLAANDAAYLMHAAGHIPAYESEYRARAKDGSWRWLAERGRVVEWWPDGTPRRMVGTLSDVTLRHQAEHETAERDERLRQITRHVPGLLYQFRLPADGRGIFPYVSERCHDVLGLDPEALMADASLLFDRVDPADRQRVNDSLSDWTRSQAARRVEFRYLHPGGPIRWMLGVSSPRAEPDGAVVWHGYLEDITDYRELEKAREIAATAEAANRAKTEFLSRMSHELRTPLNAVLGFAQLMELDELEPLGDGQRHRLTLVRESGEHLLRMISDLLDHSRIEAGQLAMELADVALLPLLRECADMLAPAALAAGVTLRWDTIDPHLQVHADPTRLKQVALNLLSNAIKYNRRGGTVALAANAEGDETRLQVIDNGMGISAAHLGSLFEPFNRLGQRRSGIEGTGIGLAITRALVTLMQGRIEVRSTLGEGSTFFVFLPASGHKEAPGRPKLP
ncbi:MAG: PAS domain-containing protein [Rhizobacter sp.]|nr:PAS domain-containing protein [Rhizobacter sp.]